jgi:hypothetical protein
MTKTTDEIIEKIEMEWRANYKQYLVFDKEVQTLRKLGRVRQLETAKETRQKYYKLAYEMLKLLCFIDGTEETLDKEDELCKKYNLD